MPKITGFIGTHSEDLCLYTALALQNTGRRVCVNDHTAEGLLFACIPTPEENLETVTFRNVDFVHLAGDWQKLDYDQVFVQLGEKPEEACVAACDELVLVTDCDRRNLDYFNRFMQRMKTSMTVVLRGYCPDGISDRRIKDYFERENCFVQKWLTLPLDEVDEAYRIGMQYEPMKSFAHASRGLDKVLLSLMRVIEPQEITVAQKAVRAVRSGRVLAKGGAR